MYYANLGGCPSLVEFLKKLALQLIKLKLPQTHLGDTGNGLIGRTTPLAIVRYRALIRAHDFLLSPRFEMIDTAKIAFKSCDSFDFVQKLITNDKQISFDGWEREDVLSYMDENVFPIFGNDFVRNEMRDKWEKESPVVDTERYSIQNLTFVNIFSNVGFRTRSALKSMMVFSQKVSNIIFDGIHIILACEDPPVETIFAGVVILEVLSYYTTFYGHCHNYKKEFNYFYSQIEKLVSGVNFGSYVGKPLFMETKRVLLKCAFEEQKEEKVMSLIHEFSHGDVKERNFMINEFMRFSIQQNVYKTRVSSDDPDEMAFANTISEYSEKNWKIFIESAYSSLEQWKITKNVSTLQTVAQNVDLLTFITQRELSKGRVDITLLRAQMPFLGLNQTGISCLILESLEKLVNDPISTDLIIEEIERCFTNYIPRMFQSEMYANLFLSRCIICYGKKIPKNIEKYIGDYYKEVDEFGNYTYDGLITLIGIAHLDINLFMKYKDYFEREIISGNSEGEQPPFKSHPCRNEALLKLCFISNKNPGNAELALFKTKLVQDYMDLAFEEIEETETIITQPEFYIQTLVTCIVASPENASHYFENFKDTLKIIVKQMLEGSRTGIQRSTEYIFLGLAKLFEIPLKFWPEGITVKEVFTQATSLCWELELFIKNTDWNTQPVNNLIEDMFPASYDELVPFMCLDKDFEPYTIIVTSISNNLDALKEIVKDEELNMMWEELKRSKKEVDSRSELTLFNLCANVLISKNLLTGKMFLLPQDMGEKLENYAKFQRTTLNLQ